MNRTRQSITVSGINTADPCTIVKDGTCEDILNMRYKHNALNLVQMPVLEYSIADYSFFVAILGTATFLNEGHFIAITKTTEFTAPGKPTKHDAEIHEVEIVNGTLKSLKEIVTLVSYNYFDSSQVKMFEFGNMLYFNFDSSEKTVMYKDKNWIISDINNIKPIDPVFKTTYKAVTSGNPMSQGLLVLDYHKTNNGSATKEFYHNVGIKDLEDQGFINGGVKLFVAYKMFDGNIIHPSEIAYIGTQKGVLTRKVKNNPGELYHAEYYIDHIFLSKPKIIIPKIENIDTNLISSIVVFSSRNIPEFDFEHIHEKMPSEKDSASTASIFYKECSLLKEPFYEIADIPISNNNLPETTLELNYEEHYKNIETKPVYVASYSNHQITLKDKYEYNNSLHGYNNALKLFNGYNFVPNITDSTAIGYTVEEIISYTGQSNYRDQSTSSVVGPINGSIEVVINIDDQDYCIRKDFTGNLVKIDNNPPFLPLFNLLSYPDARAKSVKILVNYENDCHAEANYLLTKDLANNTSYHFIENGQTNGDITLMFPIVVNKIGSITIKPEKDVIIKQTNRLYVSALNNPFYFNPSNIYTIGNSRDIIDCIECAADQITETKFGMFPLYVFTNEGIYAMEVGQGEVMYNSVIAINNEGKTQNSLTASALGRVFYIGKQGVMALNGRQSELLSGTLDTYAPINKADSSIIDFNHYKDHASILYNPIEMELIVYNPNYSYAYLFSIENKQWTRRTWEWEKLSHLGLVLGKNEIRNYWKENNGGTNSCRLITRPIKLDSLEFKRLETFVARMQCDAGSRNTWTLEGSNDLINWGKLITSGNPILRRITSSYKYYRIQFNAEQSQYLSITHFDVEYYLRFVGKLR